MTPVRAVIGIMGLALLGLLIWAAVAMTDLHGSLLDQLDVIVSLPWGVVSIADLYAGFVLFAVLVFLTERTWWQAALWAAPIFIVGNVWAAIWFVVRLPHLAKQLSKPDWPAS
ncbi:MAG: hypothetical protein ABW199_07475 [Caulobacterales bacterium]